MRKLLFWKDRIEIEVCWDCKLYFELGEERVRVSESCNLLLLLVGKFCYCVLYIDSFFFLI